MFKTTQNRAMRTYLGVGMCTPIVGLYGDLRWIPPYIRHQVAMLRYWSRLIRMPRSRITRRVFDWDYSLGYCNRPSWSRDVKTILTRIDMAELFNGEHWYEYSVKQLSHKVRERLVPGIKQQFHNESRPMSRMRIYNLINREYEDSSNIIPTYLNIRDRQKRSVLAKLRMGVLPINIETGRYTNTSENE